MTTTIEAAVADGRMKLSEYLRRYELQEVDSFNVTLVREAAERLEDVIAAYERLAVKRHTVADHGEQ